MFFVFLVSISLKVDGKAKAVSFNENIQTNWKMYFGGLPSNIKIDGVTTYSLNGNIKNIYCGTRYVHYIPCKNASLPGQFRSKLNFEFCY